MENVSLDDESSSIQNERDQVLTLYVWLDQYWTDERLMWNPIYYHNVSSVRIPCPSLWRPDIVLYNSMEDPTAGFNARVFAKVEHTGRVFCPIIIKTMSSCIIDTTYFPFDDQK